MKKIVAVFAILAGLNLGGMGQAQEISVDASIDALSGYIWRGGVLGADDKAVLQPSLTLGFGESGFSVNVWGSFFVQSRTETEIMILGQNPLSARAGHYRAIQQLAQCLYL